MAVGQQDPGAWIPPLSPVSSCCSSNDTGPLSLAWGPAVCWGTFSRKTMQAAQHLAGPWAPQFWQAPLYALICWERGFSRKQDRQLTLAATKLGPRRQGVKNEHIAPGKVQPGPDSFLHSPELVCSPPIIIIYSLTLKWMSTQHPCLQRRGRDGAINSWGFRWSI